MQSASNWGEREKIGELVGVLDVVEVVEVPNWLKSNQLWSPNWRENNQEQKKGKTPLRGNVSKEKEEKEFPKLDSHLTPLLSDRSVVVSELFFDVKLLVDKSFRILGKSLVV